MSWVLDAGAVIAWLKAEPGADRVQQILIDPDPKELHVVNLVEVGYEFLGHGEAAFSAAFELVAQSPIHIVRDANESMVDLAIRLKAQQKPIALADTFAIALAADRGATLVTTDRSELEKVALAGICQVEFLR